MIKETPRTGETRAERIKRLRMRSMRRGIKEMDLILSRFAESRLADLDEPGLAAYDALLSENDQDLYQWVTGQVAPPEEHAPIVAEISGAIAAHPSGAGG